MSMLAVASVTHFFVILYLCAVWHQREPAETHQSANWSDHGESGTTRPQTVGSMSGNNLQCRRYVCAVWNHQQMQRYYSKQRRFAKLSTDKTVCLHC